MLLLYLATHLGGTRSLDWARPQLGVITERRGAAALLIFACPWLNIQFVCPLRASLPGPDCGGPLDAPGSEPRFIKSDYKIPRHKLQPQPRNKNCLTIAVFSKTKTWEQQKHFFVPDSPKNVPNSALVDKMSRTPIFLWPGLQGKSNINLCLIRVQRNARNLSLATTVRPDCSMPITGEAGWSGTADKNVILPVYQQRPIIDNLANKCAAQIG